MNALHQSENGTWVLFPWCLPRSLDEDGDELEQGRYCIAYSRDGWWLLDARNFTVLRWCVSEEDALKAREELFQEKGS